MPWDRAIYPVLVKAEPPLHTPSLWATVTNSNLSLSALEQYVNNFRFAPGETWLANWYAPLLTCAIYLTVLEVVRHHVRDIRKRPWDLRGLVVAHNALLAIASGVLLLGLGTEIYMRMADKGFFFVFCDVDLKQTFGRVYWFYYLNYLLKYVELFDTVLLVLRDKPTVFLHVYHHVVTLILCWTQLDAASCMQWVPIIINLLVHVFMYTYYALQALKVNVWWKKYLTLGQIIQFVCGLVACVAAFGSRILYDYVSTSFPPCGGNYPASAFGIAVLLSYLLLFLVLFREKYPEEGEGAAAKPKHKSTSSVRVVKSSSSIVATASSREPGVVHVRQRVQRTVATAGN